MAKSVKIKIIKPMLARRLGKFIHTNPTTAESFVRCGDAEYVESFDKQVFDKNAKQSRTPVYEPITESSEENTNASGTSRMRDFGSTTEKPSKI